MKERINKEESELLGEKLLNMLRESPVKSKAIEKKLEIRGEDVRALVRDARRKRIPSCSGRSGYYIGNEDDVAATVANLRSRAYDMLRTADILEGIEIEGQERMVF